MRFDVTKLTYREIEGALGQFSKTPFYVSKLGHNVLVEIDGVGV